MKMSNGVHTLWNTPFNLVTHSSLLPSTARETARRRAATRVELVRAQHGDKMSSDIAVIGLAVMGQNLILNMNDHGFVVTAFNRTTSKVLSPLAAPVAPAAALTHAGPSAGGRLHGQ